MTKSTAILTFDLLTGAVIGMLIAPDKGSENRKKVMRGARYLAQKLKGNCMDQDLQDVFSNPRSTGSTI